MARWLEIAAHYGCNNRCVGCFSVSADGPAMAAAEVLDTLRYGRDQGATWLWLGGGEPTIRKDLFATVVAARKLGYSRVKLQTNGMLLAYPEFTRRCVESGVSEVNFSIKGDTAELHDRLTQTEGCFDLMMKGIAEWKSTGLPSEGDILVYKTNVSKLPAIVRYFHGQGIGRFNLWMFSAGVQLAEELSHEMPSVTDIVDSLQATLALQLSDRPDFLSSLHTPVCTLRGASAGCRFSAASLEMIVANPGRQRFRLETSPMEGGAYSPRCETCRERTTCGGFRSEYVARYGDAEFQPLT